MRFIAVLLGALLLVGLAASVSAQNLFERCEQQKRDIQTNKTALGEIETQIGNINQQIADLQKRQRELVTERADKLKGKELLIRRIRIDEDGFKRTCSPLQECDNLDKRLDDLKSRGTPLADAMRRIQDEIRERGQDITRLNTDVDRIENTYSQLKCDDLVAGQTAQETIDRCSDLFSEWNKMQTDINRLQDSMKTLRDRYQQTMRQQKAIGDEIGRLLARMRDICGHHARIADLETMEKDQHQYRAIQTDLDDMDSKVKRYRTLKIVQPKKGLKPVIRPKKDDKDDKHQAHPVR